MLKGAAKVCASKTHCPKGHELKEDNLSKYELSIGKRSCKLCRNERARIRGQLLKSKEYKKEWLENNRNKSRGYTKKWQSNHPSHWKDWNLKNPDKRKAIEKKHAQKPERKDYKRKKDLEYYHRNPDKFKARQRIYRRENPRSGAGMSYDLQDAMNNVRLRDRNTCQWQGCGLTSKQTSIHVHHIFPKSEYPDLELVEQYMICYCANHHSYWHRMRGDPYSEMISWRTEYEGDIYEAERYKTYFNNQKSLDKL